MLKNVTNLFTFVIQELFFHNILVRIPKAFKGLKFSVDSQCSGEFVFPTIDYKPLKLLKKR